MKFLVICLILLVTQGAWAQNTGVNTKTPKSTLHVNGDLQVTKELVVGGDAKTKGNAGTIGQVLTSNGPTKASEWVSQTETSGAIQLVKGSIGTDMVAVELGEVKDLPGTELKFTTTGITTILVTYSAVGLPQTKSGVEGAIQLYFDGKKQISSYFSGGDMASGVINVSNYSTSQTVLTDVPPGDHSFSLKATCWLHNAKFNIDPTDKNNGYNYLESPNVKITPEDSNAMKARISMVVLNEK